MSGYLPVIISAVLIIAILLWWLIALDGIKKTGNTTSEVAPPPAPHVAVLHHLSSFGAARSATGCASSPAPDSRRSQIDG